MMTRLFLTLLFSLTFFVSKGQFNSKWTSTELKKANTVKDSNYLSDYEREVIITLNLARLYGKKFIKLELNPFIRKNNFAKKWKNSSYKRSLVALLRQSDALPPLKPDYDLYRNARCFANEQGSNGSIGHKRRTCEKKAYAECCSYGMKTGKGVIIQLLIDHQQKSLGHRKICMDSKYNLIGPAMMHHKKWRSCCIIEFK